jgi:hypothetical protein
VRQLSGKEAHVAPLSQRQEAHVTPLSQWLQLMLAEIASKREAQERARAEQTRRAAEQLMQRTQPAPPPPPTTARRRAT